MVEFWSLQTRRRNTELCTLVAEPLEEAYSSDMNMEKPGRRLQMLSELVFRCYLN